MRGQLWTLCHNTFGCILECEDRQDTSDRYVAECNLYRHEKKPEMALEIILKGLSKGGTTSRYTFAGLTYLDLGDYYFSGRRWEKAGKCYYNVLGSGDYNDCSWAEPSWIFCCFMSDANPYELERLAMCAAMDINNDRAQYLCQMAAFERRIPNVDYLDPSTESIINGVRNLRQSGNTSGVVRCATTCQESASSINAMRLALEEICGKPSSFVLSSGKAQDPPLDETLDEEGIVLWEYRDINTPIAVVDAPSDYVGSLVGELAETDFSLGTWYAAAKEYAVKLSPEQHHELYGVMVYPPKQENSRVFAEDWLFRVQFAAVCILAQISLHEIDKICKGQLDWPIIPAFTLAAWLASQDPSYAQWAEDILHIVRSRISQNNYCFFKYAYTCAASLLPGKEEAYYTYLWQQRQALKEN